MTTAYLTHYNQNKRSIRIDTHLGKDALMLSSLTLNETLSAPFCYHAMAFSDTHHKLTAGDMIGMEVTVQVVLQDNQIIERNGYITAFSAMGSERNGEISRYQMTIEPWLSLLKTANEKATAW